MPETWDAAINETGASANGSRFRWYHPHPGLWERQPSDRDWPPTTAKPRSRNPQCEIERRRKDERDNKVVPFPARLLTGTLVLTGVVLVVTVWVAINSYRDIRAVQLRNLRVEELHGTVVYLDEVLTMSARMAAATGDSDWERRYRQFEPQLDAAIKEAMEFGSTRGAPLIAPDGHALGMLCVTAQVPRELSAEQKTALQALSRQLSRETQPRTQKTARFSGRAACVLSKFFP